MRGPTYYPTQNGHMPYPPQYGSGGFGADEDGMNIGGRGGGVPARGGRGRGPGGRMARGQGQGRGGSNLAAGRSGSGGRGRFNHQYSGVSNSSSHGDSNERETPQDPPSQTFAESIPPASMLAPQSHEVVPAMPSSVQIEDNVVENLTRNTDPVASNDPPGHVEDSVTS